MKYIIAVVTVIICHIIDRLITVAACKSLCDGKWKNISKKAKADNIVERITLSYMLRQKSKHREIILFEVVFININTITSILFCVMLITEKYQNVFAIIWMISVFFHIAVRKFIYPQN